MPETVIAIDAGTTGVACVLYDGALRPLHRAYREFPQSFPRPGLVEHDAAEILAAVDATLAEVLERPEAADVAALGVTNQRETVFAVDPDTGAALRPGIVWQDRRTADRCAALRGTDSERLVRARTGLVVDPYFSATKIEWMLEREEGLRARAASGGVAFCTVDALVVRHLTGSLLATDPTNASRTMLYDIDSGAYDPELCALFGVDPAWLPEVRPSAGDFGVTSAGVAGREIPVRGVAGDQQSALFGLGLHAEGGLKNTYGTGCFLLLHTGAERRDSERGLVTTVCCDAAGAPAYAVEGSVFMGGAIVQWLRDQLGLIESAAETEAIARSVPDTGGVHLVPAFTGLGAPYWDADARAAILGLTRGSNRAHVVRAALEAIAFQVAELVDVLREDTGVEPDVLLADGGAAENDLLIELQADLAGLAVERPESVEATARGAARLAGLAAGLWPSGDAVPAPEARRVEPRLAAADRAERMAAWRAAVAQVRSGRA